MLLLVRRQGPPVEPLRLGKFAACLVKSRLIAEPHGIIGGTDLLQRHFATALLQHLRLGNATQLAVDNAQLAEQPHRVGMGGSQRLVRDCQRAFVQRLGFNEATRDVVEACQCFKRFRGVDMVLSLLRTYQFRALLC